jgi:hypothetical protein
VFVAALRAIDGLPVGVVHDDGMYTILAKSLATGHGFRWLNVPGEPAATHYPPAYPAMLAVLWRAFPSFPANVLLFKVANALLLAMATIWFVRFLRRRFAWSTAAAGSIAVVGCAGLPMLQLSTLVMSEILFLAMLVPTLMMTERTADGPRSLRGLAATGLAAGALTLIRAQSVALVLALALVLTARRRWRDAAVVAGAATLAMVPWQLWVRTHEGIVAAPLRGDYESYGGWLIRGLVEHGPLLLVHAFSRGIVNVAGLLIRFTAWNLPSGVRAVIAITLGVLLALGARRLWSEARVSAAFLTIYFGLLLVWPFPPDRFVWVVWPFVVLITALGARETWRFVPRTDVGRVLRAATLCGAALLAVAHGRFTAAGYRARSWAALPQQGGAKFRNLVLWARANTAPGDVIASNAEPLVYLYADRLAVPATSFEVSDYFRPPTLTEGAAALREIIAAYPVTAVAVVTWEPLSMTARYLSGRSPAALVLRDSFPDGLVYRPTRR